MRMPGFSAEASLYKKNNEYRGYIDTKRYGVSVFLSNIFGCGHACYVGYWDCLHSCSLQDQPQCGWRCERGYNRCLSLC
jgi:hypothetical protein